MMLEAILKIYVHVELMGFISPGELLRIRPRCVLLRYDLYIGYPRSREFFSTIRMLSVLESEQKEQYDY